MRESIETLLRFELPRRTLKIEPQRLVQRILEVTKPFEGADEEATRRYEKLSAIGSRKLHATFENIANAMKKNHATLARLEVRFDDHKALEELRSIVQFTLTALEKWESTHPKRGRGRAEKTSVIATEKLFYLLCKHAGFRKVEYEEFLERISGQQGLPKMSAATLKKRAYRARKRNTRSGRKTNS